MQDSFDLSTQNKIYKKYNHLKSGWTESGQQILVHQETKANINKGTVNKY